MLSRFSLILVLTFAATPVLSAAHLPGRCANLDPALDGDADRAFQCITDLEAELETLVEQVRKFSGLSSDITALRTRLTALTTATPGLEIPKGAILAFDTSGGCPTGWSPFKAGQGRVMLGASFGTGYEPGLANNGNGAALREYKYRDHGGVETVALSIPEMPKHDHFIGYAAMKPTTGTFTLRDAGQEAGFTNLPYGEDWATGIDVKFGAGAIAENGGNQPHNNMPPYIALYFCQKS